MNDLLCPRVCDCGRFSVARALASFLSVHLPSDWPGKERGIIYGFLGVTETCTRVCATAHATDCLQNDSFKGSMNEDRREGEHQNYITCVTHTHTASLSFILNFQAQLAGRVSLRL